SILGISPPPRRGRRRAAAPAHQQFLWPAPPRGRDAAPEGALHGRQGDVSRKQAMTRTAYGYPATSARCRGWPRYLYRKATTPDNWDKDSRPHAYWDGISGEPTASWHRMDLSQSSSAMALMADTTPAWREVYTLSEIGWRRR